MPLTTVAKVKALIPQIASGDTSYDAMLTDIVNGVQGIMESYCSRKFDIDTYTSEQHKVKHIIAPYNFPIQSVTSIVRLYPDATNTSPDIASVTNYRIHPAYIELLDWQFLTMTNKIQYLNQEESYVEITYSAGYPPDQMPYDLSLVASKLCVLEFKEITENRLGLDAFSEGQTHETYSKKELAFPTWATAVMDKYKKVKV